jgi:cell fate regulator YaaT (PSP1 superfamily)
MEVIGGPGMNREVSVELSYLIRYGSGYQVGRFASDSLELERGQTVVVRSHRGTEIGEVLIKGALTAAALAPSAHPSSARVLRIANDDDLERARQLERERPQCFELCQRVIRDRNEAMDLIDVELLLDDRRAVLHYLGSRTLDVSGLVSTLRSACKIDVLFEPIGEDVGEDHGQGCAHCGAASGGCGSDGGGCGRSGSSHGGCSGCEVKRLLDSSRPVLAR